MQAHALPRPQAIYVAIFVAFMGGSGSVSLDAQSSEVAGATFPHVARPGETWSSLSARYGAEAAAIAATNGRTVRAKLIPGETLSIDNRHLVPTGLDTGIVVNIPQRRLFLKSAGHVVATYPVALGRTGWPTFVGRFTVVAKEINPVWDVPPSIQEEMQRAGKTVLTRVLPGPSNPLGKHWLGLSVANYGIHGTNAPQSIYRFSTHGCIRLHPEDIADLWNRVAVGTTGETIYETILVALSADGDVLLQAHPDIYHRQVESGESVVQRHAQRWDVERHIDWSAVRAVLAQRDGALHVVTATSTR